jgi:RimJ/RimL family protein N-acetyltransferase
MRISDLHVLEIQADALFTHDSRGRIGYVNEPDGDRAPRFFFGRTKEGNLWRFRDDLTDDIVRQLDRLAADEPVQEDLRAEPRNLGAFLEVLRADRAIPSIEAGPAFRFPDELPALSAPANVTRITRENSHVLRGLGWDLDPSTLEISAQQLEERGPLLAVIVDGAAVSTCFCARLTTRAAEAGVETVEAYRGRGYAPAVAAAWAHAVRAMSRIPLYSTSWDNVASQAVARKLGLVLYGTDLSLA